MNWLRKDKLNDWASAAFARAGYSPQRARDAKREGWWWLNARVAALPAHPLYRGRAVVWTHPGRCELLPVDEPGPRADEVTVAVTDTIVSAGTERSGYTSQETSYPARPGYAAAGVVVAAGRRSGVSVGDRVAAPISHCSVRTVSAASAYPVPAGVSLSDAAFTQLGIIGRRGITLGELQPGESVCVLGSGVVGLMASRLATAAGAGHVTAVARSRRREDVARASGASFLTTDERDALRRLRASLVIDASGDPQALQLAVDVAAERGRIVLLGSPRRATRAVPLDTIRNKRLTVIGAHVSTLFRDGSDPASSFRREALAFLDQLASGAVKVSDLVEESLHPRAAPAFYRQLPRRTAISVARFDWTRLSDEERAARVSRLTPPRLSAAGVDFRRKPVRVPAPVALRAARAVGRRQSGRLGIALVGCGDIGVQNAAAISSASNTSLVACFDPVERLAADVADAHAADVVRSFDELLERADVDAVFLSVPHDLHAPLAIQAAEAGRHVLVEKPAAQSLRAAHEMLAAAERYSVSVSVCFPHRYDSGTEAARALIAEGALGELRGTMISFLTDKPPSYWHGGFSGRAVSDWRASKARAGGGVLIMNLSHYIDLVLHLCGQPVESVTAMVAAVDPDAEVEDFVSASVRWSNGAVGTIYGGSAVPGTWEGRTSTELRLWGDDGHVSLGDGLEVFSLRALEGLDSGRWHAFGALPPVALRTAFVSSFATALAEARPPEISLADAVAVQAVIEATYRSAEEGRPVTVEEVFSDVGNGVAMGRGR